MREEALQNEIERRKCAKSFQYFKNKYCMMWRKEGGDPCTFEEWDFQNDAAEKMQNEQKLIFLKARQMGLSWLACAYVTWSVLFKSNFHVYITSVGMREVGEQMERIRFIWYNLPTWMTGLVVLGGKGCKDNDSIIEFTNGSAIHAIATTKAAGHGAAPGLYILDEFARKEKDIWTWRAIKPSLGSKSQVIIISTSNGLNNLYYDLWVGATKGDNGFTPVFYSWMDHPEYSEEYIAEQKRDFAGDLQGFLEAFPASPEDAFLSSSRSVFDVDRIRQWKEYIAEKNITPKVGYLEYNEEGKYAFIEDERSQLQVWKLPEKGHHYTAGCDVAQGLVKGDWSATVVYDVTTHEVVALYRAKIPQEAYANEIIKLCTFYNNAWVVVEINKGSEIVINDVKVSYNYIYCRPVRAKITDLPTLVPGFLTTENSKSRVITQLRRKFAALEKPMRVYSSIILDELTVFEQNDRGSLGAQSGKHDDTVIALALAFEGTTNMPFIDDENDKLFHFGAERTYDWRSL